MYAGDIGPKQAWDVLAGDTKAALLDVRTPAEWAYVGLPDLGTLMHQPLLVPWLMFPSMQINADFINQVVETDVDPKQDLLILCRSGVRSKAAAIALTAAGFSTCYNIAYGFEGDKGPTGHRGTINGWKVDGLAWVQG
ncbi:MAG: rhodanese-like domain-containing protein [Rhodospirillales bacterium]|nr:rhodanese-like domain-containing protein [Rhodospirillales bacterium]